MPRARALLAMVLCVTGCASTVSGNPAPAGGQRSSASQPASTLPSYQPLPDGSGFSTEPMDQPYPVPDQFWPGLRDFCEWVTPELAGQAGGSGGTGVSAAGCNVLMGGDELVQIGVVGPYDWLTDPTRFVRPVTIAGLEAREYAFTGQGAGECTVAVNTRSPVQIQFTAWNPVNRDGGSADQRCQVARTVADAVVRRYVPLAGGTPWERTPQRPGASAGEGMHACDIVDQTAAVYGNLGQAAAVRGTDPVGTTCTYENENATMAALVTDGPDAGLAEVELRVPDAAVSDRRLGELPARLEDAGTTCALSVEFAPGRIFTLSYRMDALGISCKNAEVVAAHVLSSLIDKSTS